MAFQRPRKSRRSTEIRVPEGSFLAFQRSRKSRRSTEIWVPEGSFLAFQRSPKTRRATEITIPEGSWRFLRPSSTNTRPTTQAPPAPEARPCGSRLRRHAEPRKGLHVIKFQQSPATSYSQPALPPNRPSSETAPRTKRALETRAKGSSSQN